MFSAVADLSMTTDPLFGGVVKLALVRALAVTLLHKVHWSVSAVVKTKSICLMSTMASRRDGSIRMEINGTHAALPMVNVVNVTRFENRVNGSVYPASEITVEQIWVKFEVAGPDAVKDRIEYRTGRHAVVIYAVEYIFA